MKCRRNDCSSYSQRNIHVYPICQETKLAINTYDYECNLLENIAKVRDDLIRKCRLFEEVFEIDVEDWSESIDKIEP